MGSVSVANSGIVHSTLSASVLSTVFCFPSFDVVLVRLLSALQLQLPREDTSVPFFEIPNCPLSGGVRVKSDGVGEKLVTMLSRNRPFTQEWKRSRRKDTQRPTPLVKLPLSMPLLGVVQQQARRNSFRKFSKIIFIHFVFYNS